MTHRFLSLVALGFLIVGLSSCANDAENPRELNTQDVSIAFQAILGDADFESGTCVEGIGDNQRALNVSDLRFYIGDVEARRTDADETWESLQLHDRPWQGEGITLIDLADTETESGSAGVNNYINGQLPDGDYDRLRFTLGVPFELNHSDFAVAPTPLNVGGMSWSWRGGRKFLRFDAKPCGDTAADANVSGVALHIGSTLCQGDIMNITHCEHPNRSEIEFDWTPGNAVVFDIDALLQDLDVYENTEETEELCMSDPADPDCEAIHTALGIPFGDMTEPEQRVFSTTDDDVQAHATGDVGTGGEEEHDHHEHH